MSDEIKRRVARAIKWATDNGLFADDVEVEQDVRKDCGRIVIAQATWDGANVNARPSASSQQPLDRARWTVEETERVLCEKFDALLEERCSRPEFARALAACSVCYAKQAGVISKAP